MVHVSSSLIFLYNWILPLLFERQHCTKYGGEISPLCTINASIVQGSGLGPSNFIVAISNLKPKHSGNRLPKYADDSYLLIPASCIDSTLSELDNISTWASISNLKLNHTKSKEMIVRRPRSKSTALPPPLPGIERVHEITILGVTLSDRVGFEKHIDRICCKARQSMFALRVLVAHGLRGQRLFDVVRATTVARLLYVSPAWWGFPSARRVIA